MADTSWSSVNTPPPATSTSIPKPPPSIPEPASPRCQIGKKQPREASKKALQGRATAIKSIEDIWGVTFDEFWPQEIKPAASLGCTAISNIRAIAIRVRDVSVARALFLQTCKDGDGNYVPVTYNHTRLVKTATQELNVDESTGPNEMPRRSTRQASHGSYRFSSPEVSDDVGESFVVVTPAVPSNARRALHDQEGIINVAAAAAPDVEANSQVESNSGSFPAFPPHPHQQNLSASIITDELSSESGSDLGTVLDIDLRENSPASIAAMPPKVFNHLGIRNGHTRGIAQPKKKYDEIVEIQKASRERSADTQSSVGEPLSEPQLPKQNQGSSSGVQLNELFPETPPRTQNRNSSSVETKEPTPKTPRMQKRGSSTNNQINGQIPRSPARTQKRGSVAESARNEQTSNKKRKTDEQPRLAGKDEISKLASPAQSTQSEHDMQKALWGELEGTLCVIEKDNNKAESAEKTRKQTSIRNPEGANTSSAADGLATRLPKTVSQTNIMKNYAMKLPGTLLNKDLLKSTISKESQVRTYYKIERTFEMLSRHLQADLEYIFHEEAELEAAGEKLV